MQFVNYGLGEGPLEWQIAFPIIAAGIGHDTFHRHRRVVAGPAYGSTVVGFWDRHGKTIRVEQKLGAVEPKTTFQRKRSLGTVAINLPGLQTRDEDMPVMVGAMSARIERNDLCRLRGILSIEQQ
jgi:hypothetical protein